jgi:hypothetical protein
LQGSETTLVKPRITKNRSQRENQKLGTPFFSSLLESRFLIDTGNIPASNPDPDAKRPLGLFFRAEHCADIEKSVRASLQTNQQEDCFDAMLRELAGAPVDLSLSLGLRVDVIQKVGREFERRHVAPWLYFVRSKK